MTRTSTLVVAAAAVAAVVVVAWIGGGPTEVAATRNLPVIVEPLRLPESAPRPAVTEEAFPARPGAGTGPGADADGWVREAMAEVATHPMTSRLLEVDRLAERAVEAVEAVAGGYPVRRPGATLALSGPFLVRPSAAGLVIAESSFDRFDLVVNVLEAVDVPRAAERYRDVLPRLEAVHRERSWYRSSFHERVVEAIDHLLAVEVPRGEIAVRREALWWELADEDLADMTGAQRQLVRLGSDNARRVQGVLRRFREAIVQPVTSSAVDPESSYSTLERAPGLDAGKESRSGGEVSRDRR